MRGGQLNRRVQASNVKSKIAPAMLGDGVQIYMKPRPKRASAAGAGSAGMPEIPEPAPLRPAPPAPPKQAQSQRLTPEGVRCTNIKIYTISISLR